MMGKKSRGRPSSPYGAPPGSDPVSGGHRAASDLRTSTPLVVNRVVRA